MIRNFVVFATLAIASSLWAQKHTGATLSVSDQRAPAGGRAQVQIWLTEPKPIIFGAMQLQVAPATFSSLAGATALSGGWNVMGTGTINLATGVVQSRFTSTDQNFGMNAALPLMMIALDVNPAAAANATSQLTIDTANTTLLNAASQPYPAEVRPGIFTVGGVSIDAVSPPSGIVQSGGQVIARGTGFQPGATL